MCFGLEGGSVAVTDDLTVDDQSLDRHAIYGMKKWVFTQPVRFKPPHPCALNPL